MVQIISRLLVLVGTWPLDSLFGMDWLGLGTPDVPTVVIEALARRQIMAVENVVRINELTVDRFGDQLSITVNVSLLTETGDTVQALMTTDPDSSYLPGVWFMLMPFGHHPIYKPLAG